MTVISISSIKQLPNGVTFRLVDDLKSVETENVIYALKRLHPKEYTEYYVEVNHDNA